MPIRRPSADEYRAELKWHRSCPSTISLLRRYTAGSPRAITAAAACYRGPGNYRFVMLDRSTRSALSTELLHDIENWYNGDRKSRDRYFV